MTPHLARPPVVPDDTSADVIVVGAGFAGTTAALVLGRQGRRVTLVDVRPICPPVFKAEKIEHDHAELLRKIGLSELLLPRAGIIREVKSYYNGRLYKTEQPEQYGMYYSDIVNTLRENLSSTVKFKAGRVTHISNSVELQRVKLATGEELASRLVVLASGTNGDIPASLRLRRVPVQRRQSIAIAFTIARPDGAPFAFDAVTCHATSAATGFDYLTLFKVGDTMRANLFAFPTRDDSWVRRFVQKPNQELNRYFPTLTRTIGEYSIVSKVETALINLYRTDGEMPDGVVLIGDAAQNVCPSVGMGLTKILTDVDVLCSQCASVWFSTPGMGKKKLSQFYNDPRKREIDAQAIENAFYRRQACIGRSLRWRIHRTRLHVEMQLKRLVALSTLAANSKS